MSSYKDESDKFHQLQEQREKLAERDRLEDQLEKKYGKGLFSKVLKIEKRMIDELTHKHRSHREILEHLENIAQKLDPPRRPPQE